jgi:putative transposase
VVWIPKYRKRALYGQLRKQLAPVLKELANQKESEILEGRLVEDHVHMLISIPPKYAVAQVIGYMKGKSAIWIARTCGRRKNFIGQNFWARGYYVTTAGLDGMKKRCAITSGSRKTRTRSSISSKCSTSKATFR